MKGTALIVVLMAATALAGELTCPEDQADNWTQEQLLRHEDCNKFYKCTFGEPVEQNCYHGLHFNLETWQCDWPENVDCTGRNDPTAPAPEVEETEEVPEEEEVAPEESSEEEVAPEGSSEEVVAPEESSEEEVAPEEASEEEVAPEESSEEVVAPEEASDEEVAPEESSEEVVAPEEASEEEVAPEESSEQEVAPEESSEEEVAPEEETPEEEEISEPEFLPNGCPADPHKHWLLPSENSLNEFYYCVWGELVLRECPSTLVFNPILQVCDWP